MSDTVFDHLGGTIRLGPTIAAGGEGTVCAIDGSPGFVAKIYHKPPSPDDVAKLRAMIGWPSKRIEDICKTAAWPIKTLHKNHGQPALGFVMLRMDNFSPIHKLYGPRQRRISFPKVDWYCLTKAARNCAAAFATLHEHGVVIGDVNESNVRVSDKMTIAIIDCDSFQIQEADRVYRCNVGVPTFTPPELQGKSLRHHTRSVNHDRFGLAVMIFHLLMMGRHPFAGRFLGHGNMEIEHAIRDFRYAYGSTAEFNQMQPPPHSVPLNALSSDLVALFERAFSPKSTLLRPSPKEWVTALDQFEKTLLRCQTDLGHRYPQHLGKCVWCHLMAQQAPNFFISVGAALGQQVHKFDLSTIWRLIDQVDFPTCSYSRPLMPTGFSAKPWPTNLPKLIPSRPTKPATVSNEKPPAPRYPPWPAHLPTAFPAKPIAPSILTSPPDPPIAELPSLEVVRYALRPSYGQQLACWIPTATALPLIVITLLTYVGRDCLAAPGQAFQNSR